MPIVIDGARHKFGMKTIMNKINTYTNTMELGRKTLANRNTREPKINRLLSLTFSLITDDTGENRTLLYIELTVRHNIEQTATVCSLLLKIWKSDFHDWSIYIGLDVF